MVQHGTIAAGVNSEEFLHCLFMESNDAFILVEPKSRQIVNVNPAAQRLSGFRRRELLQQRLDDLVHGDDATAYLAMLNAVGSTAYFHSQEGYTLVRREGAPLSVNLSVSRLHCEPDALALVTVRDVSERRRLEAELRASQDSFSSVINSSPDAILVVDHNGMIAHANPAAVVLFGRPEPELRGAPFGFALSPGQTTEVQVLRPGGEIRTVEIRFVSSQWQGKPGHLALMRDVTATKAFEEQLRRVAFHDALTGLANRGLFLEHLKVAVNRARRSQNYQFAVLVIDLDRFKMVNDSLGHLTGDHLLLAVAERLKDCARSGDVVARLGGDEFAVFLDNITDLRGALHAVERIQNLLDKPVFLYGQEAFTTASIGITMGGGEFRQPEDLLREADTAMHRAKAQGGSSYAVFNTSMHQQVLEKLQIETDLRKVADYEGFTVEYQPIIALESGRIAGFEALVRWTHPQRGRIAPSTFIPVAEETGLIIPLGLWVLRTACRQIRAWHKKFGNDWDLHITVNLSNKQFSQPNLIDHVIETLRAVQLEANSLRLELTESTIMESVESAVEKTSQLAQRGVDLLLDDFGTGYSSLGFLNQFPIAGLKIDKSFVSEPGPQKLNGHGLHRVEIVRSVVSLAHNLGMKVVAEGVETVEQLEQLRMLKCEYAQGFLISPPLSADAAETLLAAAPVW
jgi:diguanylate cyclase (GGDEF)-like protein/PAS domain S-box-containing protein